MPRIHRTAICVLLAALFSAYPPFANAARKGLDGCIQIFAHLGSLPRSTSEELRPKLCAAGCAYLCSDDQLSPELREAKTSCGKASGSETCAQAIEKTSSDRPGEAREPRLQAARLCALLGGQACWDAGVALAGTKEALFLPPHEYPWMPHVLLAMGCGTGHADSCRALQTSQRAVADRHVLECLLEHRGGTRYPRAGTGGNPYPTCGGALSSLIQSGQEAEAKALIHYICEDAKSGHPISCMLLGQSVLRYLPALQKGALGARFAYPEEIYRTRCLNERKVGYCAGFYWWEARPDDAIRRMAGELCRRSAPKEICETVAAVK